MSRLKRGYLPLLTLILVSLLAIPETALANGADGRWSISVEGQVKQPYNLTYSELLEMPQTTVNATLYCVDAPGYPVEEGSWKGVQLKAVLDKAVLKEGL